ncbi:unnamed protein product [Orchesella dallaii]|uniref:Carboxylic ester hydrolase n=1 Tax=Orchesella dallaii TaxID=48710 RepID=A0ABP1Q7P5_9HEXA
MRSYFGRKTSVAGFVVLLAVTVNYYRNKKTLSPILEISTGKLQGVVSFTRAGKEIHDYMKIPFSKPPVGTDLRFEPPQPAESWVGVRDATETGPQCLQVNMITGGIEGSEDCLFLNVYTPKERKGLLPVMVWIHGGAFVFGTANRYRPAYLLDEDVILVTTNYRLAGLGFLNTGDGLIRGNMGLKDQNMALKWVQENIKYFGGDPTQVTLFGESAGSASVGFHTVSPLSKGLFSRAIMQSGSPLGNWAINREPAKQAKRFAAKFNCSVTDPEEMVACLKAVDGHTFVKAHQEMLLPLRDKITLFVPTIETVHDKNTFLPEEPLESLLSGRVNKVPLIVGVNKEEGLLSSSIITANKTKLKQANDEWNFFAAKILGYDLDKTDISDKIRHYYFGDVEDIGTIDLIANYTNLFSDRQFFVPVHKFVKYYTKQAPVRMYLYSYQAEFSLADMLAATQNERLPAIVSVILELLKRWVYKTVFRHELPHLGVCHADELQLIFNWPLSAFISENHKDFEMSRKMVKLWTDFVKNSDSISINDVVWPNLKVKDAQPLQYLDIDKVSKMIIEPFTDRIDFWDKLGL